MTLPLPSVIWVVPTTRCNTRCRTCGHFRHDYGEDMSLEVFAKLENELLDSVKRVHLVGGGEPLISKIFPDMLKASAKRGIKIFFITNSIALKEELLDELVKLEAEIMVSVDGASPETYNYIRPLIKFERLLDKLELIAKVRARHPKSGFKLLTNTVVMQKNLPELAKIVELAKSYGVDTALFSDLIPHYSDPEVQAQAPVLHPKLIGRHGPQALARAKELGLNIELPAHYPDHFPANDDQAGPPLDAPEPEPLAYAQKDFIFAQKCGLPWTHANILADGNVSTCCITDHSLGDLNRQSFAEIWHGKAYQSVRRLIHTNNPPKACKRCNLAEGISAGNPSFFRSFLSRNHLRSLIPGEPGAEISGLFQSEEQAVWLHNGAKLSLSPGEAEFAALHFAEDDGIFGNASYAGKRQHFNLDDSCLLLALPDSKPEFLDIEFELSGQAKLLKIDLLSYDFKSVNLTLASGRLTLNKFKSNLTLIEERLQQALSQNPGLESFAVFGANSIGGYLRQLGEQAGLEFAGYLDNYIGFYDGFLAHNPEQLERLRPDVVLISSKAHALTLEEQVRREAAYGPVVISSR